MSSERFRLPTLLLYVFLLALAPHAVAQQAAAPLPNVRILATGGTIAGTGASSTTTIGYTAAKVGVEALIAAVPELKKVANVDGEQVFQIASESMTNAHWLTLAKRVNTLLAQDDVDGIVITHGTDTIEETAYFLNLVVKSRKPVVIVGSMRPSTAISADGPINLYNAVIVAGSRDAVGKGVLVVLNDQINSARDVTKANTSTLDTFRSPELGLLGYMQDNRAHFYRMSTRRHTLETEFDVAALDQLGTALGRRADACLQLLAPVVERAHAPRHRVAHADRGVDGDAAAARPRQAGRQTPGSPVRHRQQCGPARDRQATR